MPENRAILRIIDANANRLREGLRVCEDVVRFVYENVPLTVALKSLRHQVQTIQQRLPVQAIRERSIQTDAGTATTVTELKRRDAADILAANFQRAKEATRVLEECAKIDRPALSRAYKQLRYELYQLEQQVLLKLVQRPQARYRHKEADNEQNHSRTVPKRKNSGIVKKNSRC